LKKVINHFNMDARSARGDRKVALNAEDGPVKASTIGRLSMMVTWWTVPQGESEADNSHHRQACKF